MTSQGTPEELRRWIEDRRAAQERKREAARGQAPSGDPIAAALDLIDLAARLHGWPIPRDEVRLREDELARERWNRLRKALGGP